MIYRKILVGGRVQGVFYRAAVARRARELGITGYAKNLADGRVEVLACGDAQHVQSFIEGLWIGSTASKVTSVEAIEVSADEIQRTEGFFTA